MNREVGETGRAGEEARGRLHDGPVTPVCMQRQLAPDCLLQVRAGLCSQAGRQRSGHCRLEQNGTMTLSTALQIFAAVLLLADFVTLGWYLDVFLVQVFGLLWWCDGVVVWWSSSSYNSTSTGLQRYGFQLRPLPSLYRPVSSPCPFSVSFNVLSLSHSVSSPCLSLYHSVSFLCIDQCLVTVTVFLCIVQCPVPVLSLYHSVSSPCRFSVLISV